MCLARFVCSANTDELEQTALIDAERGRGPNLNYLWKAVCVVWIFLASCTVQSMDNVAQARLRALV